MLKCPECGQTVQCFKVEPGSFLTLSHKVAYTWIPCIGGKITSRPQNYIEGVGKQPTRCSQFEEAL